MLHQLLFSTGEQVQTYRKQTFQTRHHEGRLYLLVFVTFFIPVFLLFLKYAYNKDNIEFNIYFIITFPPPLCPPSGTTLLLVAVGMIKTMLSISFADMKFCSSRKKY